MNEQIQRAYDALQQADAAGNTEDAQKIADYIRELEAQAMVQDEKKPAPAKDKMLENPLTYGMAGAALGRLAGHEIGAGVDTAARAAIGRRAPGAPAPSAPPAPAPRVEPSMAPPQPARIAEPPPAVGPGAMKNVAHNVEEVLANRPAMSLAKQAAPGFEARPGRLIATPIGADLSMPAPAAAPMPASTAPAAAPEAPTARPSMIGRMSRALGENRVMMPPSKSHMYLGGAMAAGQARDAYEQMQEGNVGQAALSGTGALGGLGMFSRIKPVRALGTALGLGVPLARMYKGITEDKEKEVPVERRAIGGLAGYANKGKVVKEAYEYGSKQAGKLSDWAQNYINQYLTPIQSDRMAGVGGPSFSANSLARPEYKGLVWGQGKPSAASAVGNLALDKRYGGPGGQVFAPLVGEAQMHKSNQIIFDRMLEDFYKNPEKLTPELRSTINDYIRSGGTISGKTKQTFDPIEGFDIADREMVESLGKTFDKRKAIAQHAFGGEGIGGRKAQIIPYEQILKETTDPNVLGAPTFSVGPRAFRLTGETLKEPRPDLNAAFPHLLHGEDLRVTYNPVPSELSLMDFQRQWRKDTGKTLPLKSGKLPQPGYYEHTMGYKPTEGADRVYPRQKMTEDWIKELQRSGFKKGGLS